MSKNRNRNRAAQQESQTVSSVVDATLVAAVDNQTAPATTTPPKSIRSLVMAGLLAGRNRKDIAADINRFFPTSQAAVKSTKHISWYAGRMKKDGVVLPPQAAATVQAQELPAEVEQGTEENPLQANGE